MSKNKYLAQNCMPRFKGSANGKKVFECATLWEAVQEARAHWQVKPKDFNWLEVMLVEKDGKQIVHLPLF
jgi:hypothetical protein